MSPPFPEISELVPHAQPMLLLERVLEHAGASTVCSALTSASRLFAIHHHNLRQSGIHQI